MNQTILVIDDDAMNREVMEAFLSAEDYTVALANNGKNGVQQAQNLHPDLILLDVRLPDMSGYEVCKTLKNDTHTQTIPIMMMTGLDEAKYRQMGMEAGADDFLSRPFDGNTLIQRVGQFFR